MRSLRSVVEERPGAVPRGLRGGVDADRVRLLRPAAVWLGCGDVVRRLLRCHFRARPLAKQGLRERLVASKPAPGRPFDNGLFEVVTEPINSPDERPVVPNHMLKIRRWSNTDPA